MRSQPTNEKRNSSGHAPSDLAPGTGRDATCRVRIPAAPTDRGHRQTTRPQHAVALRRVKNTGQRGYTTIRPHSNAPVGTRHVASANPHAATNRSTDNQRCLPAATACCGPTTGKKYEPVEPYHHQTAQRCTRRDATCRVRNPTRSSQQVHQQPTVPPCGHSMLWPYGVKKYGPAGLYHHQTAQQCTCRDATCRVRKPARSNQQEHRQPTVPPRGHSMLWPYET